MNEKARRVLKRAFALLLCLLMLTALLPAAAIAAEAPDAESEETENGQQSGDGAGNNEDGWRVTVSSGEAFYEIEFILALEDQGAVEYIPFCPLEETFSPAETDALEVPVLLKAIRMEGESVRVAPDEVQELLMGVTVSVSEVNEDGSDPTSYVSWNESAASGLLLLQPGFAFSAVLTAAFTFDGAPCSITTSISYTEGEEPGNEDDWRALVNVQDTPYEIEFLDDCGDPYINGGSNYLPDDIEGFSLTLPLAAVKREDRTLAEDAVQALITEVVLSFAPDEDGGAEPALAWNADAHEATISAAHGSDFSGTLTAAFLFDGERNTVRIHIHYSLLDAYLAFVPEGETEGQAYLTLSPSGSLSGHFVLCRWDGERYNATTLTDEEAFFFASDDPVLALDWGQDGLVTIVPTAEEGWFGICCRDENETYQLNGEISDSQQQDSLENSVTLPYQGASVTACAAFENGDEISPVFYHQQSVFPDYDSAVFRETYFVQGFTGDPYGENSTQVFLDDISNVTARLENGTPDLTLSEVSRQMIRGHERYAFSVTAKTPNLLFEDRVIVTFEYNEQSYSFAFTVKQKEAHLDRFEMNGQRYAVGLCASGDERFAPQQRFAEETNTAVLTLFTQGEDGGLTPVTDEATLACFSLQSADFATWDGEAPSAQCSGRSITWTAQEPFNANLQADFAFAGECEYTGSVEAKAVWRENELSGGGGDEPGEKTDPYLRFQPLDSSEEQSTLYLVPQASASGKLVLYQWDEEASSYTRTLLSAEELSSFVSLNTSAEYMELSFTWDDSGLVTITHTGQVEGPFTIAYAYPDAEQEARIAASLSGYVGNLVFDSGLQALEYGDEIVHTGVGFLQSGSLRLGDSYGDSFEENQNRPFSWSFVLGGLRFYQDKVKETYALSDFFDRIVSCRVDLKLLSGSMPSVSEPVKKAYSELENAKLYTFVLSSEPDTPFVVQMAVTFTYKENGWQEGDPLTTYTATANVHYQLTTDVAVDASDLDTVEALNSVLGSKAALRAYLKAKGVDFIWQGTLRMDLPAVDYSDGVICCDCGEAGFYGIGLHGSDSGEGTVFRALEVHSGLNFVNNIAFAADPDVLQSYDGSAVSCGVLVTGCREASASSIYSIDNCSFSGYTVAIRSTTDGYSGSVSGCTLSDCDCGVYIDSDFDAAGNSENSWNTYLRCGDAIYIRSLPNTITSYMYRIHDNVFLDCGRDLNILDAGSFFCYGNFFGSDEETRRSAELNAGENTAIITNPCRSTSHWTPDSRYWIDPALPTEILNAEASSLMIDPEVFSGTEIEINVVNMEDGALDTVGTWTFGGEGA